MVHSRPMRSQLRGVATIGGWLAPEKDCSEAIFLVCERYGEGLRFNGGSG
jgi:hypothetical protein